MAALRGRHLCFLRDDRMNFMSRRHTVLAGSVLALASIAVLAGCAPTAISKVGTLSTSAPAVSVPSSFPKAVPLYSGKVVDARGLGSGTSQIWTVTISLPNEAAIDSIKSALGSAGFSPIKENSSSGSGSTIVGNNKAYSVLVVEAKNSAGWFASYTVTHAK